jgi:hypothetical protein
VLGVIVVIITTIYMNKIPTIKAISSAVIVIILEGIFETVI